MSRSFFLCCNSYLFRFVFLLVLTASFNLFAAVSSCEPFAIMEEEFVSSNTLVQPGCDGPPEDSSVPGSPNVFNVSPSNSSDGSYSVTWSAASGTVTQYKLFEKINSGGWALYAGSSSSPVYFSGRADGIYYYYAVACYKSTCGEPSPTKSVTVSRPKAPSTPDSLRSSESTSTDGEYAMLWSGVANVSYYELKEVRGSNSSVYSYRINTAGSGTISHAISGKPADQYAYQVRACNSTGCSSYSQSVTVIVKFLLPGVPGIRAVFNNITDTVNVSWLPETGGSVSRYEVQQATGSPNNWLGFYQGGAASSNRSIPDGHYYFRVRACNSSGCSAYSVPTAAVEVINDPSLSGALSAAGDFQYGDYSLNWNAGGGRVDRYVLQQGIYRRVCSEQPYFAESEGLVDISNLLHGEHGSLAVPDPNPCEEYWEWSLLESNNVSDPNHLTRSHVLSDQADNRYRYRVQACNSSGCSDFKYSIELIITRVAPAMIEQLSAAIDKPSIATDSDGVFKISWAVPKGHPTHYVWRSRSNTGAWSGDNQTSSASLSFSGLADGHYDYQVRACYKTLCNAYIELAGDVYVLHIPNQPAGFTVQSNNGTGSLVLAWSPPSSGSMTASYKLFEYSNGQSNELASINSTTYQILGKSDGQYIYGVRACNVSGCGEERRLTVAVLNKPVLSGSIALSNTDLTNGDYRLSWPGAGGSLERYELFEEEYYNICDKGSCESGWNSKAVNLGGYKKITQFNISNQINGRYRYKVKACNASGCSAYITSSEFIINRVEPAQPGTISAPRNVNGSSSFTVSWTKPSKGYATYYLFYKRLGVTADWGSAVRINSTAQSIAALVNVERAGPYDFRVSACNAWGCGSYREYDGLTYVALKPAAPASINIVSQDYDRYEVSWGAAGNNPERYRLFEKIGSGNWLEIELQEPAEPDEWLPHHYRKSFIKSNGYYTYKVQACNTIGCGDFTAEKSITINLPETPDIPEAPAEIVVPADPGNDLIAELPGSFAVTPSGAASYTVPLDIPSGSADVKPPLSLSYNSQGGNGIMGVGWSLQATSVISRCPQSNIHERNVRGIKLDAQDPFCLDGVRLIEVGSEDGRSSIFYRTEIDGINRIIYENGWFKVQGKDGTVMEYGRSEDAKIYANDNGKSLPAEDAVIITWARNRVIDSAKNYIDYHYDKASAEFYLSSIRYTGHLEENTDPFNDIVFFYEERDDDFRQAFIAGSLSTLTKRLSRIEVMSQQQLLYEYRFDYSYSNVTGNSLLKSMTLCSSLGNCLPKTRFTWQQQIAGDLTREIPTDNVHFTDRYSSLYFGDFNGDGKTDFIRQIGGEIAENTNNRATLYVANGDETFAPLAINESERLNRDDTIIVPGDFNGDGVLDFIRQPRSSLAENAEIYFANVNGDGGFTPVTVTSSGYAGSQELNAVGVFLIPGDFNGDGVTDFIRQEHHEDWINNAYNGRDNTAEIYISKGNGHFEVYDFAHPKDLVGNYYRLMPGDYNGDGQTDFISHNYKDDKTAAQLYLSNGVNVAKSGGDFFNVVSLSGYGWLGGEGLRLIAGDFNRDGLSDFIRLALANNGVYVYELTLFTARGDDGGTFNTTKIYQNKNVSLDLSGFGEFLPNLIPMDYNADGKLDILYQEKGNNARTYALIARGDGEFNAEYLIDSDNFHGRKTNIQIGDFNADGKADIFRWHLEADDNYSTIYLSNPDAANPDLIKGIETGFGTVTAIDYKRLSEADVYTRHAAGDCYEQGEQELCSYLNVITPMPVVHRYRVKSDHSNVAPFNTRYHYAGLKMDMLRRGSLGFRRITRTDEKTGMYTVSIYEQYFPYIGMLKQTEQYLADGTLIAQSHNDFNYRKTYEPGIIHEPGDKGSPYERGTLFPYIETSTEHVYDLNGELTHTVISNQQYDHDANVTRMSVSTIERDGSEYKTITDNEYGADNRNQWQLGRLTRTTVTKQRPGQDDHIRVSEFVYYDDNKMIKSEKTEPGTTFESSKTYEYDAYGNITKTTVSGYGLEARVTRSVYDQNHRFVNEEINALGQRVTKVLQRNKFGSPVQVESLNGVISYFVYGELGGQYFTYGKDGSYTFVRKEYAGGSPAEAAYKVTTEKAGAPRQTVVFDRLGREVRTVVTGFDGRSVLTDTEYNLDGTVKRKSNPYYQGETSYWTQYRYDNLGRVVQMILPNGGNHYTYYEALTTRYVNPLGQQTSEQCNALGEKVRVTDQLGGTIEYYYNTAGLPEYFYKSGRRQAYIQYDILGNKISMSDADMGSWKYKYNVLGELMEQTDAKGQRSNMAYDRLGRMYQRVDRNANGSTTGQTAWLYDSASYGLGKLHTVEDSITGYRKAMTYDVYGRIVQTDIYIDGNHYIERLVYDRFGRIFQHFDASGNNAGMRNHYNEHGYLYQIQEARRGRYYGEIYRRINAVDAYGNVTDQTRGNGINELRNYDAKTGRLSSVWSGDGRIQDLQYRFDMLGNLIQRIDRSGEKDLSEDFQYDDLNRLTDTLIAGGVHLSLRYDLDGNIEYKSDVGDYRYAQTCNGITAGPHAVSQAGGKSYCYDKNGNQISGGGRNVVYTGFNKPSRISKGGHITELFYAPSRSRYKRVDHDKDGKVTTTYYIGNVEIIRKPSTVTETRRNVAGAIVISRTNNTQSIHYKHTDHLGSTDVITDGTGKVIASLSFDAFGKQRSPFTWDRWNSPQFYLSPASNALTSRGYTGHEHLDEVGLIHMNGRVYDPALGRFLSADPNVQAPDNTQNLNRYSYVINNPLSYTDPSGYFFQDIVKFLSRNAGALKAIAISAVLPGASGLLAGIGIKSAVLAGVVTGAIAGGVSSGSWEGALQGAISGVLFAGAGAIQSDLLRTLAHGAIGGARGMFAGGNFWRGFVSAGVTNALASTIGGMNSAAQRVFIAAIVGGTSSAISGGKFANGAITGAFSRALNDELHYSAQDKKRFVSDKYTGEQGEELAAFVALDHVFELSWMDNREYAGFIYKKGDGYYYSSAVSSESGERTIKLFDDNANPVVHIPDGAEIVAVYHTHGNPVGINVETEIFSGENPNHIAGTGNDVPFAMGRNPLGIKLNSYLAIPVGERMRTLIHTSNSSITIGNTNYMFKLTGATYDEIKSRLPNGFLGN